MSRLLERRVAAIVLTKTFMKLGSKRKKKLINRAVVADSFEDLSEQDRVIIENAEKELSIR